MKLWSNPITVLVIVSLSSMAVAVRRELKPFKYNHQSRFHRLSRFLSAPRHPGLADVVAKADIPILPVKYINDIPFEGEDEEQQKEQKQQKQQKQQQQPQKFLGGNRRAQSRPQQEVQYRYGALYSPMRIHFITDALLSRQGESDLVDANINFIINETLPQVANTWSNLLGINYADGKIYLPPDICFGILPVPSDASTNGVGNAELIILVAGYDVLTTGSGTTLDVCTPDTLAVATFCAVDEINRPIVGMMNFCHLANTTISSSSSSNTSTSTTSTRLLQDTSDTAPVLSDPINTQPPINGQEQTTIDQNEFIAVATHEMAHILGMDFELFKIFRDPVTGFPYEPGPRQTTFDCSDNTTRLVEFPVDVVQFGVDAQGDVYFELYTQFTRQVVRNHFNCQSLSGARLQVDPSLQSCVGSHFHPRLFYSELMAPLAENRYDVMSPITLAALDDGIWYQVNYSLVQVSPFAQNAGCDFVQGRCIVNDTVPSYGQGIYCSTPTLVRSDGTISPDDNDIHCEPLHRSWALCDLYNLSQVPDGFIDGTPRSYFNDSNLVSPTSQLDYCPMPIVQLPVDCTDPSTNPGATYLGEVYGSSSRCVNAEVASTKRKMPACFNVVCNETSFKAIVNNITCDYDGQVHQIRLANTTTTTTTNSTASFTCPRLATVCPQLFCPSDCSGRGICKLNKTQSYCDCTINTTLSDCRFNTYETFTPTQAATSMPQSPISRSRAPTSGAFQTVTSSSSVISTMLIASVMILSLRRLQ